MFFHLVFGRRKLVRQKVINKKIYILKYSLFKYMFLCLDRGVVHKIRTQKRARGGQWSSIMIYDEEGEGVRTNVIFEIPTSFLFQFFLNIHFIGGGSFYDLLLGRGLKKCDVV